MLDVADDTARHWFIDHPFTTAAIVSVLVLLITVLNVDRVARRRQQRERSRVIAAQAAIVSRQGQRATDLARDALDDETQREAATDELRNYMTMLLITAPILIDAPSARAFLEAAQRLAALVSIALQRAADGRAHELDDPLDRAADGVAAAAAPLTSILNLDQLAAVDSGDDPGDSGDSGDRSDGATGPAPEPR